MLTPDTFIHNCIQRMRKKDIALLIVAEIVCAFTHYYLFTQRFINEDMLGYSTYSSRHFQLGRWSEIMITFLSPSVIFLLICILLPITAFLVIKILGFSSSLLSFFSIILLITFPTLSYAFCYILLISIYCFTLFEAVLAVYITQRYKYGFLLGALLVGISCGGYQSSIAVSISLCFCSLFFIVISGTPTKKCFTYIYRYLSMGILGILIYFIGMKLSLYLAGLELSSYKGVDEMGQIPFHLVPQLLFRTYNDFFRFFKGESFFYASNTAKLGYILFVLLALFCITNTTIDLVKRKSFARLILMFIFVSVAPLVFNLFDFVIPQGGASALNVYQFGLFFLWLMRWSEYYINKTSLIQWLLNIACIMVIFNFYYIDNVHYLKAETIMDRSKLLWNRILYRIEETEGYEDNMPLMIVSSDSYRQDISKHDTEFSPVILKGYDQGLGGYTALGPWANYKPIVLLRNLFGTEFSPVDSATEDLILNSPEYLGMNIYPEDGSSKIISGVMVVNFNAPIVAKISYSEKGQFLSLQSEIGTRLSIEEFSYVWYIYHNGEKIDTVYTSDTIIQYPISNDGEYSALLFLKSDNEKYNVQRQSNKITIKLDP